MNPAKRYIGFICVKILNTSLNSICEKRIAKTAIVMSIAINTEKIRLFIVQRSIIKINLAFAQ